MHKSEEDNLIDFDHIAYLEKGNNRQQSAWSVLTRYEVMLKLKIYDPILVGTIPIEIDIESSDLDILCQWENKQDFIIHLKTLFGHAERFKMDESLISGHESVIASFMLDNFELEIFGQQVPVRQQLGYRHMVIESRLLEERGPEFKQQVIALKKQGYKTEPAFGYLLGLENDPYQELLKYEAGQL